MKWKRKGGRVVAEEAGILFRVDDDGTFAVRLPSGAWEHGKVDDMETAKAVCEKVAVDGRKVIEDEKLELERRRREADELAKTPAWEKGWSESVAKLLVMVTHDHIAPSEIAQRLPPAAMRDIFERLTADKEVMTKIASTPRAQALRDVENSILGSLRAVRQEA
jgi:hypothetical protein